MTVLRPSLKGTLSVVITLALLLSMVLMFGGLSDKALAEHTPEYLDINGSFEKGLYGDYWLTDWSYSSPTYVRICTNPVNVLDGTQSFQTIARGTEKTDVKTRRSLPVEPNTDYIIKANFKKMASGGTAYIKADKFATTIGDVGAAVCSDDNLEMWEEVTLTWNSQDNTSLRVWCGVEGTEDNGLQGDVFIDKVSIEQVVPDGENIPVVFGDSFDSQTRIDWCVEGWAMNNTTKQLSTDITSDGNYSVLVNPTAGAVTFYRRVTIKPNTDYVYSAEIFRPTGSTGACYLDLADADTSIGANDNQFCDTNNQWQKVQGTFNSLDLTEVLIRGVADGSPAYFDNFELYEVGATKPAKFPPGFVDINGSFEEGLFTDIWLNDWQVGDTDIIRYATDALNVLDGTRAMRMMARGVTTRQVRLRNAMPIEANTDYIITAGIKKMAAGGTASVYIDSSAIGSIPSLGAGSVSASNTSLGAWETLSFNWNSGDLTGARIWCSVDGTESDPLDGDVFFDQITIEKVVVDGENINVSNFTSFDDPRVDFNTVAGWMTTSDQKLLVRDFASDGVYSVLLSKNGGINTLRRTVPVKPNTDYIFSADVYRPASSTGQCYIDNSDMTNNANDNIFASEHSKWERISGTFNSGDLEAVDVRCVAESIAYFDNLTLQEVIPDVSSEDPSSEDPSSEDPSSEDPSSEDPSSEDPSSEDPSSEDPSSEDPSSEDPSSEDPSSEDPSSEDPSSEDPSSEDPSSEDPSSEDPSSDVSSSDDPVITRGDVNGDGEINSIDALIVLKYSVDLLDLTDDEKAAADVDESGDVDSLDALNILKYNLNLISW